MARRQIRVALTLDLQWPYKRHSAVFAGVVRYAEERGWHAVVDEFVHETLSSSRSGRPPYDGIIARARHALLEPARHRQIPVVNVWSNSPLRTQLPNVFPDYVAVGRQCAEHLLTRGFRQFATLAPPKSIAQQLIVREFVRVVKDAGFGCFNEGFPQDPWHDLRNWRQTEHALQRCITSCRPPLGIYIAESAVGRMAAQACRRRGLKVPADVAIIAGQNDEAICVSPRPSLTSVEFGFERIGFEAARLLDALMAGEDGPSEPILLPPEALVIRESTDFHAVQHPIVAAALQFIAANCHRSIGQDDVAEAVHCETRTLQNHFRKHLSHPIVAEIRRVRIERAKRELTQSDRRLSDIARDVGFGSAMRMYEVFRRELRVAPGEYRKQRSVKIRS